MITDIAVSAVTDFLKASGRSELSDVSFFERDYGLDLSYPACVTIEDGSPEEHEVIRGQWTIPLAVILYDNPEDDPLAVSHRLMTQTINDLIGDADSLMEFLGSFMQINDSVGGQGVTEAEDGFRQTTFSLEIKGAEIS